MDLLHCLVSFCKKSIVYLVCRRFRDVYKVLFKKFRYYPPSILLNLNTTEWYLETQIEKDIEVSDISREKENDKIKRKVFAYACRYAPIEVISRLISKGYHYEDYFYKDIQKKMGTIESLPYFPPNCCLKSLDLDKIKWFMYAIMNSRGGSIFFNLNIKCILENDNIEILQYLCTIGYKFVPNDLEIAAMVDALLCFKFMAAILKQKLLPIIVPILTNCASSNKLRIPKYLLEDLYKKHKFKQNDINYIFAVCVGFNNLPLITYLHSMGLRATDLDKSAANHGNVDILKWMKQNNIVIHKNNIIEKLRSIILLNSEKVAIFTNKTIGRDGEYIKGLKEDIEKCIACITYLEQQ